MYFTSENRYLLFITENYATLEILKQYIQDQKEKSLLPASREKHLNDATKIPLFHLSSHELSEDATDFSHQTSLENPFPPLPTSSSSELSEDATESTQYNCAEKQSPPLGDGEYGTEGTVEDHDEKRSHSIPENEACSTLWNPQEISPPLFGSDELSQDSKKSTCEPWKMEPFILFGSSFPKDKEYTQVTELNVC